MDGVVEADHGPGYDHSKSHLTRHLLVDDSIRQDRNHVGNRSLVSTLSEESDLDKKHASRSKSTAQKNKSSKKLERHTMSLWLASAFAIASIFIWAITCTLSYKPVQFGTYFDTTGQFSRSEYEKNDRWRRVSRVGLQVLGTLSLPLTSAICARAVVGYCQRSSSKRQPAISMRQTLALADKGWLDLNTWMNLFGPMGRKIYSPLLILSILLCGLGRNMLPLKEPTIVLIFL